MKKLITFILLISALTPQLNAQFDLKVEIRNLKSDSGKILIELLDENQDRVLGTSGIIKDGKSTITFKNVNKGRYAVRYFHDENSNDQLDTNMLGIPKESYGMSNEPYGMFGPKDFEKWLFILDKDTQIEIKTKR